MTYLLFLIETAPRVRVHRQRGNAEEAHQPPRGAKSFGRCARGLSQHAISLYGSVHFHDNSLEQSIISYDNRYHKIIDNYHISSMNAVHK